MTAKLKTKLLYYISVALIVLQVMADMTHTMPIDEDTKKLIIPIIMALVLVVDAISKYFNNLVDNNGLWITAILAATYVLGGLADNSQIFNLSPSAQQWLRFIVTFLSMANTLASERLYPAIK